MTAAPVSPVDELNALIAELVRTHAPTFVESDEFRLERDMPDFVTSGSGLQVHFFKTARARLYNLTALAYQQFPAIRSRIDGERFGQLVRQTVGDLFADRGWSDQVGSFADLVRELTARIERLSNAYTHFFPAWTCGLERTGTWTVGPVRILSWDQWLERVDFPDALKASYLGQPDDNALWKQYVREALKAPRGQRDTPGLANVVMSAVEGCPAVVEVEVRGMDTGLSRKLGEIVAKTALDGMSLLLGYRGAFLQQALQSERLPPAGGDTLVATNGQLWLPGGHVTDRISPHSPKRIEQHLKGMPLQMAAIGHIVDGLLAPNNHPHPRLVSRWATALDWYAEGQRERSDGIALAKIGTALDVLSSVGKFNGILEMLSHLLTVPPTAPLTHGIKSITLKGAVKRVYDEGRSQILHGSRHDRMEVFEAERNIASFLARIALIEAAVRLKAYGGSDDQPTAFRTMPPAPKAPVATAPPQASA